MDHIIELWSIQTIKQLVKSDVGITYLPQFTAVQEWEQGELVEIPTELSDSTITAVCGYHKNKWFSPLMKLFLELSVTMITD